MATIFRPRTLVLFLGDLFSFAFALWLSLFLRSFSIPSETVLADHFTPFSLLFAAWVAVFFIAGLYESRSIILARRALSATLLVAQTFNVVFAALFFFFIPLFGIAPKTILGIYLIVSFLVILLWRAVLYPRMGPLRQEAAIMIGQGPEVAALSDALGRAPFAPARIVETVSPESPTLGQDITKAVTDWRAKFIIADFNDPRVAQAFPGIYNFVASGIRFFDALTVYEQVFGRIPLSRLNDEWLAQNVSPYAHTLYDPLKRVMDIAAAVVLGAVSLVLYPVLFVAIKAQDGGRVFYAQERVGENNKPIIMRKFRSMTGADQGAAVLKSSLTVTPLGRFMRKTRIDETPQLWNVLKGDLSLIGPRPEFPALVEEYSMQIPYYNFRHLVKPGLSGWAQLYHDNHPHHGSDVEATREKLSYDLYYLKHRSLVLDITIALKTIKKILTRSGK